MFYRLADFKSGTERKRCKLVWPTPINANQFTVNPTETVQNDVRTRGFGSNLKKSTISKNQLPSEIVIEMPKFVLESFQSTTTISSGKDLRNTSNLECAERNYGDDGTDDKQKLNEIAPYDRSVREIKDAYSLSSSLLNLSSIQKHTSDRRRSCKIRTLCK